MAHFSEKITAGAEDHLVSQAHIPPKMDHPNATKLKLRNAVVIMFS